MPDQTEILRNSLAAEYGLNPSVLISLSPEAAVNMAREDYQSGIRLAMAGIIYDYQMGKYDDVHPDISDIKHDPEELWQPKPKVEEPEIMPKFPVDRELSVQELLRIVDGILLLDHVQGSAASNFYEILQGEADVGRSMVFDGLQLFIIHQMQNIPEIRDATLLNLDAAGDLAGVTLSREAQEYFIAIANNSPIMTAILTGSPDISVFDMIVSSIRSDIEAALKVAAYQTLLEGPYDPNYLDGIAGILPENSQLYNVGPETPAENDAQTLDRGVRASLRHEKATRLLRLEAATFNVYAQTLAELGSKKGISSPDSNQDW